MRIGLISDTHIPVDAEDLPHQVKDAFCGVDLILHAGDIYRAYVLDELQTIAPVMAALGDDDPTMLVIAQRAQKKHILKVGGLTLLLTHYRPHYDLYNTGYAGEDTVKNVHDNVDVVVFGHEHKTVLTEEDGGRLWVSPGSPTFLHYKRGLGTVGILDINDGKAEAHIVQLC